MTRESDDDSDLDDDLEMTRGVGGGGGGNSDGAQKGRVLMLAGAAVIDATAADRPG